MNGFYGECLRLEIFGQSHAESVGMTLEGVPAGSRVDFDALLRFMQRRAPGRSEYATARREADVPEFTSGLRDGVTDGMPITAVIRNTDVRPRDYDALRTVPRPGHADYSAWLRYGSIPTGGGEFSGRMTAPLCIAGGICLQLLENEGVSIRARVNEIGGAHDEKAMHDKIMQAKAEGDSVGGVIECVAEGVPAGLGGALFGGMESRISAVVFGIPAVKGIEFGAGFASTRLLGSENNDEFCINGGRIETRGNNCGGILGGITDGMPLVFRAAVKPTPSIAKPQRSVDLHTLEETTIEIHGRHDACIVPRAVPCVEAAAAIAIYDAWLARRGDTERA